MFSLKEILFCINLTSAQPQATCPAVYLAPPAAESAPVGFPLKSAGGILAAAAAAVFLRRRWRESKKPRTVFSRLPEDDLARYQLSNLLKTPREKRV